MHVIEYCNDDTKRLTPIAKTEMMATIDPLDIITDSLHGLMGELCNLCNIITVGTLNKVQSCHRCTVAGRSSSLRCSTGAQAISYMCLPIKS